MIRLLVCALTLWLPLSAAAENRSYKSPGLFDRVSFEDQVRIRKAPNGDGGVCDAANVAAGASSCPLLTEAMVFGQNDGGFCMPATASNGKYLEASPAYDIAYNAATNTMYANAGGGTYSQNTTELTVPAPIVASSAASLSTAAFVGGGLIDATEGKFSQVNGDSNATPTALLVYNGRLLMTSQYYYSESAANQRSHLTRPLNFSTTGDVVGLDQFTGKAGTDAAGIFIARMHTAFCGIVPTEWVTALGGYPVFCGSGATYSIINNQSHGPAMFTMDPGAITNPGGAALPAQPLVFYGPGHHTLGEWDASPQGQYFRYSTQIKGGVIIDGTRTALFFGTQGTGTPCYGPGTSNKAIVGNPYPDPVTGPYVYCYDPIYSASSNHAWPYDYYVWAYDLLDFKAVVAGTKNAWEPIPYASMQVEFPIVLSTDTNERQLGGAKYNPANRHLFLTQKAAGCSGNLGVVWRFTVDITP